MGMRIDYYVNIAVSYHPVYSVGRIGNVVFQTCLQNIGRFLMQNPLQVLKYC